MSPTRREFIRTILLASGAVFTDLPAGARVRRAGTSVEHTAAGRAHGLLRDPRNQPRFPEPNRTVDVIVIGAGVSGLATACRLWEEGRDVLVLENESALGGTMRSVDLDGASVPIGSTYFVRYSGEHKALYDDVGFKPIETGEDALHIANGEAIVDWWSPSNLSSLPYGKQDIDAFRRFREVVMALDPPPRYPLARARPDDIERFDRKSAESYVRAFGSDRLTRVMDLYCRSVLGAPLQEVNAYALLNFYAYEFGDSFNIPAWTAPGGLGALAERIGQRIGADRIVRSATVVQVAEVGKQVITRYVDAEGTPRSIAAKAVVIAIPKRVAMHVVTGLPEDQRSAMAAVRYAPYVTIAMVCREPLFRTRAFDFWFDDPKNRFTDVIDATSSSDAAARKSKRTEGLFTYMVSSPRPESERRLLEAERWLVGHAQAVANALDEHVPGARDKIEEMRVMAWGHSLVIPAVGSHARLHPALSRPFGRIVFAGADNDIAPGHENAIDAGLWAAGQALGKN
jgi:phytoene dehydrogenase-like protein